MKNVKIVIVGVGSASFGTKTLGDVFARPQLAGSELWLVDIKEEALQPMGRLANRRAQHRSTGAFGRSRN